MCRRSLQTAHIDVVAYAMPRQVRSTAQMNTYAECAARRDARLACGRCRCAQRARRHRAGDVDLDDSRSPMLSEAAAVRVMQCIVNRGGRLMLQSSQNTRAYPPSCPGCAARLTDDVHHVHAFGRFDARRRIAVILNDSSEARTVTVPAWRLSIPDGTRVTDLLTGSVHEVEFGAHYGAILVQ